MACNLKTTCLWSLNLDLINAQQKIKILCKSQRNLKGQLIFCQECVDLKYL